MPVESVLFLLNSAPSQPGAARAIQSAVTLRAQGHAVSLFLFQDAVLMAVKCDGHGAHAPVKQTLAADIPIYALGEDLAMRGFTPLKLWEGIQVADYNELVDLFEQHTRVIGAL